MSLPLLVIGGPVSKRAWIMEHWFNYVEEAMRLVNMSHHYLFVGDPVKDPETFEIINRRAPNLSTIVEVGEAHNAGTRTWAQRERKEWMVTLRNLALVEVRVLQPTYYLSLDSDILIHPQAIASMVDIITRKRWDTQWDAVGGKCYMDRMPQGPAVTNPRVGTASPSYLMMGRAGNFRRRDTETPSVIPVDIIMAIKLMGPRAYAVNYEYHNWGEDIGWAYACRERGLQFAWDGQVISKHVMEEKHLHTLDPRCGY